MARTVPGSGAVIEPIFDEIFGVRAVRVKDGGTGYDPADPPRLTVDGCGFRCNLCYNSWHLETQSGGYSI